MKTKYLQEGKKAKGWGSVGWVLTSPEAKKGPTKNDYAADILTNGG